MGLRALPEKAMRFRINRMDQNLKNTIGQNFGTESNPIREEDNFQDLISCSSLWPMHGKRSVMLMCSFSYLCFLTWKINSQLHSAAWICSPSFFFEFKKYIYIFFCPWFKSNDFWSYDIIFSYQPIKTFIDQNKTFENSKQKIRLVLHFEAGRFHESGQFGIYRPGSHGNFVLSWNQPCDYVIYKIWLNETD